MKSKVTTPRSFLSVASRSVSAIGLIAVFACVAAAQQWTGPDANNNISNTNSGNVGIGTNNPAAKVHVQRDVNGDNSIYVLNNGGGTSSRSLILFGEAASDAKYAYFGHFGANYAGSGPAQPRTTLFVGADSGGFNLVSYGGLSDTGGKVSFWTAPTAAGGGNAAVAERMRITSNGYVGIGTTSPGTLFHVKSTTANAIPRFESTFGSVALDLLDKDDTAYSYINFGTASGRGWQLGKSANSGVGPDGGFYLFELTSGSSATRLAVSKGGNVGIGTTSPGQRLSVAGTVESTSGGFKFPDGTIQTTAASGSGWSGSGSIYYTGGNVGIGTTNPDKKLVVMDGPSLYLKFLRSSNDGLYLYADGDYYGLNAYDFTNNVYKPMSIGWGQQNLYLARDGGKVGIGTTTPTGNFDVVDGSADNTPSIHISGNIPMLEFDESDGTANTTKWQNFANANLLQWRLANDARSSFINVLAMNASGNVGIGKTDPEVKLDVVGDIKASGTIHAKYQDLAEWVPSSEKLAAGTVVVLDTTKSNQVVSSGTAYDTRVAGVISAQPGITLGESGEGRVLVATTGRVRVKVDASRGPIQIGDLLVTSDIGGVAMKSEAVNLGGVQIHRPGTIIGKALEPLAKGSGEILVLLSLQ